jgi:hypothetical protein
MQIQVQNKEKIINVQCIKNQGIVNTKITLPTEIDLIFSGKNEDADTIVDSDGKIIKDLFVKIIDMKLNSKQINPNYWKKFLILEKIDGNKINTAYIGFNGRMCVSFQQKTFFTQMMYFNNCIFLNSTK